jgi:DNA-directed RNA polymerase beta subunit
MNVPEPAAPTGVEMTEWNDFPKKRQAIMSGVKDALQASFPQSMGGVRLELHNLDYDNPKPFSLAEQKEALLGDRYLHHKLRGTLRLVDEKTGDVLDEQHQTLMRVPYLTERGTFIHNGNELSMINQARLQPGIYTRRKSNGELEAHVNSKRGSGHSFRVRLEPDSGLFKMDVGQSSMRLYSLLKDIGVPDAQLEKSWGKELLESNRQAYDSRVFDKAYARLVRRPDPAASREQKVKAIRDALGSTYVDRETTSKTLPQLVK